MIHYEEALYQVYIPLPRRGDVLCAVCNKCSIRNGGCSVHARCEVDVTPGQCPQNVTCTCFDGFFGDGVYCTGPTTDYTNFSVELRLKIFLRKTLENYQFSKVLRKT